MLIELQRDMRRWLHGDCEHAARRLGAGAAPGLRVYQNNYRAQLVTCLEESFVHTRAWLGDDAFGEAVIRHIRRVPPSSWTLDAYPRDFPATLQSLYPDDPEVAELAWLELALGEAFVAADAPALTVADVDGIDWDEAVLRFTLTLDLGPAATNAAAIWSALDAEAAPPAVEIAAAPGALLVWRRDFVSHFRVIEEAEHRALLLARAGTSFAALCAWAVDEHGERDGISQAGAWLGQWLGDGLLMGVEALPAAG